MFKLAIFIIGINLWSTFIVQSQGNQQSFQDKLPIVYTIFLSALDILFFLTTFCFFVIKSMLILVW